jgi:hypothetical protein
VTLLVSLPFFKAEFLFLWLYGVLASYREEPINISQLTSYGQEDWKGIFQSPGSLMMRLDRKTSAFYMR